MKKHLHYNMFLFKLEQSPWTVLGTQIYITVCFYLNSKRLKKQLSKSAIIIYITVCFYLNSLIISIIIFIVSLFTLQYVSI